MAYKQGVVGFGYLDSVLRIEARPSVKPLSREEVVRWLDAMVEAGVDAWKYSVSAKGSFPLFPSKVLPYRKEYAEEGYYQWVVEQAHQRGITILSWEYMNTAPLLTAQHPEYRVRFLGWDVQRKERDNFFACFLSPYGQLLKDYCVEVVNDLGMDGLWLDGSCLFGWGGMFRNRWFCCCDRCAEAFGKASGLDCPREINWKDDIFKRFIQWRYDFFENYWAELADYVRQRNPHALIVYNFFNRHYYSAMSGSPLRHREMDALISSEDSCVNVQMQLKVNRAVSGRYPVESYSGLISGARPTPPFCETPDPTASIYFAKAAATVGGWATFGTEPLGAKPTLTAISAAMKPIAPYIGGEPIRCCGLVFSGATKDFAHLDAVGDTLVDGPESFDVYHPRHKPAVDVVWGMGFLLNALHLPFEMVLENQLEPQALSQYPVVLIPDAQCMDESAATGLREYVEAGGVLLVTGETGTRDLYGRRRPIGVLDELLGIEARSESLRPYELEATTELLRGGGLPGHFMISGMARPIRVADHVLVHARTREPIVIPRAQQLRNEKNSGDESFIGALITERKLGKGRAMFVASDIGSEYSQSPSRRSREVVGRMIGKVALPYQTDAPSNVQLTAWRQKGNLVFHLLNQPSSLYRMPGTLLDFAPEDFTPTCPIRITVEGAAGRVFSLDASTHLAVERSNEKVQIVLNRLDMHDVIVLEDWRAGG